MATKSHARIIEESGKIGHGIYASIRDPGTPMKLENDDLLRLELDVLRLPPAAALPSNLSDFWLDAALQSVEQVVSAHAATDPAALRLPLTLVLHVLDSPDIEMSDEQLFYCLKLFRFELAMEKLRRWGVNLREPATEATIFEQKRSGAGSFERI